MAGLGVGIALYLFDPAASPIVPSCPFRAATGGLLCPGCGSLRMLHALLHGDLAGAWRLSPLGLMAMPLLAWFLADQAVFAARDRHLPRWRVAPIVPSALSAMLVGYAVLRNLLVF